MPYGWHGAFLLGRIWWRRLNGAPILSRGLDRGSYEWLHHGIGLEAANLYQLEIDLGEETIEHGPTVPGE
jgi:hypothetical protein